MKSNCGSNALNRTLATILSFCIAASPIPVHAQDNDIGQALTDTLDPSALDKRLQGLEARVETLTGALDSAHTTISALETGMGAMAKMIASVQDLGSETQTLIDEARDKLPDELSDQMKSVVEKALETIRPGEWTKDLETNEILKALRESHAAAEAVQKRYEAARDELDQTLLTECSGVSTKIDGINAIVPDGVPSRWTAELAATAVRAELSLPDCLLNDDNKPREDLNEFIAEQEASQEMATAMNSMMMAAMATANPYIIAAALAIMAIMAIFGDDGGGEGDGNGSEGESDTSGGEADTSEIATRGGTQGNPENDEQESPESTGSPEPSENTNTGPGTIGIELPGAYSNVEPGFGATVSVRGDGPTIVFTSTDDPSKTWKIDWGPPSLLTGEGDEVELPEFSDTMKFISVDLEQKSFVISMPVAGCPDNSETILWIPPGAADEDKLVVNTTDAEPCIGARD